MNFLNINGYLIIRGAINKNNIQKSLTYIKNDEVNYHMMQKFINSLILPKIGDVFNENVDFMKFRLSDNNNSTDAASFHKDTREAFINSKVDSSIFTCIHYWDMSTLEVIPGSHKKLIIPYSEMIDFYSKRTKIILYPGDLVLFHSNLLHRGTFYMKSEHRRILQIFDIVKKKDYNYFEKNILHIPCIDNCNIGLANTIKKLNKSQIMGEIINFISYTNVAQNYSVSFNKRFSDKEYLYISPEANAPRLIPIPGTFQKNNLYITKPNLNNITSENLSTYNFYSYYLNHIIQLLTLIFIITAIVLLIKLNN